MLEEKTSLILLEIIFSDKKSIDVCKKYGVTYGHFKEQCNYLIQKRCPSIFEEHKSLYPNCCRRGVDISFLKERRDKVRAYLAYCSLSFEERAMIVHLSDSEKITQIEWILRAIRAALQMPAGSP